MSVKFPLLTELLEKLSDLAYYAEDISRKKVDVESVRIEIKGIKRDGKIVNLAAEGKSLWTGLLENENFTFDFKAKELVKVYKELQQLKLFLEKNSDAHKLE
jgi:hypothetical protein